MGLRAQPGQTLSGQVTGYLANRTGDYDGLLVRTATTTISLGFPPHTAAQVLKLAPVGQLVTASVERRPKPPGPPGRLAEGRATYQLSELQNEPAKTSLQLSHLRPPAPSAGILVNIAGVLTSELRDDAGRLTGLLVDQYLIALNPDQGESLRILLMGAKRISVVGYQRTEPGFVNKTGRKLIHPTTLTINGQTFAL